jgi:hypothetical protein
MHAEFVFLLLPVNADRDIGKLVELLLQYSIIHCDFPFSFVNDVRRLHENDAHHIC